VGPRFALERLATPSSDSAVNGRGHPGADDDHSAERRRP
jgi:hypothetical protein